MMDKIVFLQNSIQNYAWGSKTTIPKLLGLPSPASKPQAELWIGSHHRLPSQILLRGKLSPLDKIIQKNPREILGRRIAAHFRNELPFLLKILAIDQPLSLQAHPDGKQAKAGFREENLKRIPLNAENRNFKDPNPKPEVLCALTPVWALCGFRPFQEMIRYFKKTKSSELHSLSRPFTENPNHKELQIFFSNLMHLDRAHQNRLIREVSQFAKTRKDSERTFYWIHKLYLLHPNDIGILSPLFLNLIHLKAGEAIYLPPRQLHSYLEGTGVELMGNSDNVLRGGLTSKHLDISGLIKILNFSSSKIKVLKPQKRSKLESVIPGHLEEFSLSVIHLRKPIPFTAHASRNIEIMLCLEGEGVIETGEQGLLPFKKGMSWLIPACVKSYSLRGSAKIYKATVPF